MKLPYKRHILVQCNYGLLRQISIKIHMTVEFPWNFAVSVTRSSILPSKYLRRLLMRTILYPFFVKGKGEGVCVWSTHYLRQHKKRAFCVSPHIFVLYFATLVREVRK